MKHSSCLLLSFLFCLLSQSLIGKYLLVQIQEEPQQDKGAKDNEPRQLRNDLLNEWRNPWIKNHGFRSIQGKVFINAKGPLKMKFQGNQWTSDCGQPCNTLTGTDCPEGQRCRLAKDRCHMTCENAKKTPDQPCQGPPTDQKGCRQIIRGFTFDSDSNLCKKFMEGGCSMTNNGFRKKEDCEAKCITSNVKPKKNPNQPCQGPPATRACRTRLRRISGFTFDTDSNLCEKFNMTGSCVTKNYFRTKEDCEAKCSTLNVKLPPKECLSPSEKLCDELSKDEICGDRWGGVNPNYEDENDSSPKSKTTEDEIDYFNDYYYEDITRCPQCGCKEGCNPDFVDNVDDNCATYKIKQYCTSTGDYGPGWNTRNSPDETFEDYAANGQTALVCPECGCGRGN